MMNVALSLAKLSGALLPQVVTLEQESFALPWTFEQLEAELTRETNFSFALINADSNDENLVAYVVARHVAEELHILTLGVHPTWRRQGCGAQLLQQLLLEAESAGVRLALLEVRVSNTAAQKLYQKLDFNFSGMRRGYYSDNGEDAQLLSKELDPSSRTIEEEALV